MNELLVNYLSLRDMSTFYFALLALGMLSTFMVIWALLVCSEITLKELITFYVILIILNFIFASILVHPLDKNLGKKISKIDYPVVNLSDVASYDNYRCSDDSIATDRTKLGKDIITISKDGLTLDLITLTDTVKNESFSTHDKDFLYIPKYEKDNVNYHLTGSTNIYYARLELDLDELYVNKLGVDKYAEDFQNITFLLGVEDNTGLYLVDYTNLDNIALSKACIEAQQKIYNPNTQ